VGIWCRIVQKLCADYSVPKIHFRQSEVGDNTVLEITEGCYFEDIIQLKGKKTIATR
jgi:hypothetical protein